jgi:hypothetical protein
VPAALDIYAVRALRAHRDVVAVVGSMIVVQALAHLVQAHLLAVSVPLVVVVSAIAPLVLWRVHRIGEREPTEPVVPNQVPAVVQRVPASRLGEPSLELTETGSEPGAERVPKPTEPVEPVALSGRQGRREGEVNQVLHLIRELGYGETTLTVVMDRLELPKSTAYGRLTEARKRWNQVGMSQLEPGTSADRNLKPAGSMSPAGRGL